MAGTRLYQEEDSAVTQKDDRYEENMMNFDISYIENSSVSIQSIPKQ